MSAIHVNQIARKIRTILEPYVPKDDIKLDDKERDIKILTRCLAAFAVQAASGCTDADAGNSVVDGGDDNGLDAIFFSATHNQLILVQSKWIKDGKSEPDSASVGKFCNGVTALVNNDFDSFNQRVQKRQQTIENALSNFNCRLVLILVHTGLSNLAIHSARQINLLLDNFNDAGELASFQNMSQDEIYRLLVQGAAGGDISLEFGLSSWGKIETPHISFYGAVTGTEIAQWWSQYGERLFEKNIRNILGNTDVNEEITKTIDTRPEDFWYFNNGITITAKKVEKTAAGGGNRDLGNFRATGSYIVNGAQTVSSIGRYTGERENLGRLMVPVRVISLDKTDETYGALITRTNNTQNRIEARDFVSQDPEQMRIRTELHIEGVQYQVMRAESFTRSNKSFDLEEATVALACASGDPGLAVTAKREIGRFWIELNKSPYKAIFNASVSSLYVYHAVLVQRLVDDRLKESISQNCKRSGKRYGVLVHGNRLVAALTFRLYDFRSKLGDSGFQEADHRPALCKLVDEVVDSLVRLVKDKYQDNFPAVVFKNPTKCKELFDACVSSYGKGQLSLNFEPSIKGLT